MHSSIIIKDHSYNARMYSSCFTASSAIDWLLINGYVDSRSEGVQLCKELVSGNLIIPLTNQDKSYSVLKMCFLIVRILMICMHLWKTLHQLCLTIKHGLFPPMLSQTRSSSINNNSVEWFYQYPKHQFLKLPLIRIASHNSQRSFQNCGNKLFIISYFEQVQGGKNERESIDMAIM